MSKKSRSMESGIKGASQKSEGTGPIERRRTHLLEGLTTIQADHSASASVMKPLPMSILDEPEHPARIGMGEDDLKQLRDSLARIGLIDALKVFPKGKRYEILDGHRRFLMARELGWREIRCEVFTSEDLAIEAMRLATNQDHAHMTPWEEAVYFASLCDRFQLGFEELCTFVHKSETYVSDRLLLLQTEPETQEAMRQGHISMAVAKQLRRLKDRKWELYYLDLCMRSGTGATVLTGWINSHLQRGGLEQKPMGTDPAQVITSPPPVPLLVCEICNSEHLGRTLIQVWVHADEWQMFKQQFAMIRQSNAPVDDAGAAGVA